jgi:hypothetical protein
MILSIRRQMCSKQTPALGTRNRKQKLQKLWRNSSDPLSFVGYYDRGRRESERAREREREKRRKRERRARRKCNPCLQGTALKQRWPLMTTPETLKFNDILPFQKVMTMENSSSKLLCQLFLGMARRKRKYIPIVPNRARTHVFPSLYERGRRDVSRRGEQEENVCTVRRPPRQPTVGLYHLGLVHTCVRSISCQLGIALSLTDWQTCWINILDCEMVIGMKIKRFWHLIMHNNMIYKCW